MIEKILSKLSNLGWVFADYYPDETAIHRVTKKSVAYDDVVKIVQEVAKDGGWIPCSERLPEAHKNVLVCENNGEIHLCRYNDNMKRFFYDGSDWDIKSSEVAAWKPLPEPYQEGE